MNAHKENNAFNWRLIYYTIFIILMMFIRTYYKKFTFQLGYQTKLLFFCFPPHFIITQLPSVYKLIEIKFPSLSIICKNVIGEERKYIFIY